MKPCLPILIPYTVADLKSKIYLEEIEPTSDF